MNKAFFNLRTLFLGGALLVLCSITLAAVPPLLPEERQEMSDIIFTGGVESVQSKLVDVKEGFVDRAYLIAIQVDSVQKGEGKDVEAGKRVIVSCKQPEQRPDGFAGPQGQNFIPKKGDLVKVFCRDEKKQIFILLEPNGIDDITPKPQAAVDEVTPE